MRSPEQAPAPQYLGEPQYYRREQDMQQLFEQAINRFGRLDCVVNNAGWHPPAQSMEQVSVEEFEQLVRLNLTSTFMGASLRVSGQRGGIVHYRLRDLPRR